MSSTFAAATKALTDNPELLAKVSKAGGAEERAALMTAAGIAVPTHADVNAHVANMAGVAGGTNITQVIDGSAPIVIAITAGSSAAAA
jgi:hypothetical protein